MPARDASYSSSISAGSTRLFIFITMRPVGPERGLRADAVAQPAAQALGRDEQHAVADGAAVAGEVVEQLGELGAELGVGGEQAEVLVERGGLRVVVAGADVAVAADAVVLLTHDEEDLGVGLQPDEAVHHVDARFFQHPRPFDVGLLVEARLELHERDDLLALARRADECSRTMALSVPAVR